MATPAEKLAESLDRLTKLQEKGIIAIKSNTLSRTHRERLLQNGFIGEVYKGWYISVPPLAAKGDSTSWYSSFWEFCAQLMEDKFGKDWCLSPEQSLLLHGGNTVVPNQLIIRSPAANNSVTAFPHNTSLFLLRAKQPSNGEVAKMGNLRIYSLAASLVRASPNTFTKHTIDVKTALSLVRDASGLLTLLLEGGHSAIAGRLAGALRNIQYNRIADDIVKTMKKAGFVVRESDPFEKRASTPLSNRLLSPYGNRIKLMW